MYTLKIYTMYMFTHVLPLLKKAIPKLSQITCHLRPGLCHSVKPLNSFSPLFIQEGMCAQHTQTQHSTKLHRCEPDIIFQYFSASRQDSKLNN